MLFIQAGAANDLFFAKTLANCGINNLAAFVSTTGLL